MGQDHHLAIFRGTLKFKSNVQKIWGVLILLSIITGVEVVLGIYKPNVMLYPMITAFEGGFFATLGNIVLSPFIFVSPLNFIFLFLTVVKAYYITWDFMHMRDEKSSLRRSVVWTFIFLAIYLTFILLTEGDYIFGIFKESTIKWNF